MQITRRPYQGDHDKTLMANLVRAQPQANLHVVDLPYRLSSWAFDDPDNGCLWEDERGEVLAWAVLQTPFWAIDYAYRPTAPATLHRQILTWADLRAQQVRLSPHGRPMWFINVFDWQQERRHDLEVWGFASQADVGADSWSKVFMRRPSQDSIADTRLPAGFAIRPLHGQAEVDAYVTLHRAVFESDNMTTAWRRRTLQHIDYRPDLDLVAIDPDGQLAALCVGWFAPHGIEGQPSGQIEPLGVRADVRGLGLGRAMLAEGLRRLRQAGATHVYVETDNYRDAAFGLYEAAGFQVIQDVLVYRKDYPG
jgi:mycothiol synthase